MGGLIQLYCNTIISKRQIKLHLREKCVKSVQRPETFSRFLNRTTKGPSWLPEKRALARGSSWSRLDSSLPLQQVADELIGHQKALGRQPPPAAGLLRPALGLELAEPGLQGGKVHEIGAAVLPLLDALGGTQPEHQVLAPPLPLGDELLAVDDLPALEHAVDVPVQVPDKGVPPPAEVGVGAGAEADIGPGEPVAADWCRDS